MKLYKQLNQANNNLVRTGVYPSKLFVADNLSLAELNSTVRRGQEVLLTQGNKVLVVPDPTLLAGEFRLA